MGMLREIVHFSFEGKKVTFFQDGRSEVWESKNNECVN